MAEMTGKILEGVFAVKKPKNLSSAQVLRDLQYSFKDSKTFAPLRVQESQDRNAHYTKRRRIDKDNVFKMGHGGTLDPMATGVLIVGIGRGTKHLQSFLDCTKVYRTVVLFGKSTDTYDVAGKIVASKETKHISKELVEQKIKDQFSGDIKQVPPIYSALKIDGMKAYEYARSGKQLPRELAARPVTISQIELAEWHDAGDHDYRWPAEQAPEEEKALFQALTAVSDDKGESKDNAQTSQGTTSEKEGESFVTAAEVPQDPSQPKSKSETAALHTHAISQLSETPADAPAATIEMTVSSGFYVRSLAHDLGLACDSYGTMAELARTRQGDYTIEESATEALIPAIDYAETQQGEDIWGPKIAKILESWMGKNPPLKPQNNNARANQYRTGRKDYHFSRGSGRDNRRNEGRNEMRRDDRKRRNSSSPER